MDRFVLAGNHWMLMAFVLFVGRYQERTEPIVYSFFHSGQWFSAEAYGRLIGGSMGLSVAFFVLSWVTRRARLN